VFVTLWEKRDSSRIVNLEHYLVKSMKYKVIDHIRSQIVKNNYLEYHKIYLEQAESQTENTVALNDLSYAIETGLRTLPERSRQVFRLSRYESWPVSEIASHLNLSEKGVEYHLTKSIRTLRIYLKEIATVVLFVFSV
jgi:RNA polymerase sigma factor (sigma-70 family)